MKKLKNWCQNYFKHHSTYVKGENLGMKIIRKYNKQNKLNIEEIKRSIIKYPVISFDIFDTLLKRNVRKPKDVFEIIERKYNILGFAKNRINAEKKARSQSGKEEVTLSDIYEYLTMYSKKRRKRIQLQECLIETELWTVNLDILEIYKECISLGKRIYIISDMYLPVSLIETTLHKCGITDYSKIFISCEYNATKRKGTLFHYFLNEEHINSKDVLHIGDSYESDFTRAMECGINAIQIPRDVVRDKRCFNKQGEQINLNILYSFINNNIQSNLDKYYEFGFDSFGPFLWGYIRWLHLNFKEKNIKKVYFFSRDGLIMKKAYDIYFGENDIKTYYLEVSRRSLRVPILWIDCSFHTLLGMLTPSKLITIKSIFDGIGLDIINYRDLLTKYGFNENSVLDRNDIMDNRELQVLYSQLTGDIIDNSRSEYEILVEYIKQNNISGKFAVVDIGWSGGMQRFLSQTLNKLNINNEIYGYYTGVAAYYNRNQEVISNLNLNGYLFDFSHNPKDIDVRSSFVGLFETLFLEQDGSVKCYRKKEKSIIAERYPYEYIIDGKATKELSNVMKIQSGALDFIKKIASNKLLNKLNLSASDLFYNIYNCGTRPKEIDIELFSDFLFYDEGETIKLAAPESILHYLQKPKEFKRDFMLCRWKIGFMKRLFKVKLPYENMYKILLKFK